MVESTCIVSNTLGIHARPAAQFAKMAAQFSSEIHVENDGEMANGKSIMGLMMLGAGQGSSLTIKVNGEDEEQALATLVELVKGGLTKP